MRRMLNGILLPPRARNTASERVAFHRQRTPHIGARSAACVSISSMVPGARNSKMDSNGKLFCGPIESSTPSSVAAACSSKSKVRQNRFRNASPKARFCRAPNGACTTSCIPPASSKKRSAIRVRCVGNAPSASRATRRYRTICSAPAGGTAHSRTRSSSARTGSSSIGSSSWRRRETSSDSSGVRPGASPFQNGTDGGAPWAFSTRTRPASTRRIFQLWFPSRKMSPAMLSTAQSSSTWPMVTPSGSATTAYCAVSGMAPPLVSAAMRDPRRAFTTRFTPSRWSLAPCARPARRATPSACISTSASNSLRGSSRYGQARRTSSYASSSRSSSQAAIATSCWARMSRGHSGMRVISRFPRRMPRTSAAHSTSWSRVAGKSRPLGVPPRWCDARPTRWTVTEKLRGDSSCTTRSTAPTSMPSSKDAVATAQRTWPRLSFSSAASRMARDMLPWCATTWSSPSRCASWCATRSTWRRVLTNTSVVRCARISSATRSQVSSRCSLEATAFSSSRGTSTATSSTRPDPLSTIAQARPPVRNRPISSIGLWVAERPTRTHRRPQSASSRSSERARWAPRLSRATAWISSTITVRTVRSVLRPPSLVSSR